ncbi:MAG: Transglycosylase-associated protein [Candidatus Pacebacteria bacterium GW2011_GWB1_47_8]|nr:MAG: Transglycosylase-associated protein [Candidatus Pacebacteria bacterium GW2011_GWA1_46_10]KKU84157.1 MAG: Transglycosylase-associated protein [Candidatus Pacebacteria bacterium GW2011_GWB1_47_8]HCR80885.1 GlsB/YeaQ/YmgE family stress response membrane protein [Candidatus Paceibacterota bacterium]
MGLIAWIVLGLLAGWLASMIMGANKSQGMGKDVLLGIIGAVVGGWIMGFFGQPGVTGLNLYSIVVAMIGAIALIWVGRTLSR